MRRDTDLCTGAEARRLHERAMDGDAIELPNDLSVAVCLTAPLNCLDGARSRTTHKHQRNILSGRVLVPGKIGEKEIGGRVQKRGSEPDFVRVRAHR